MTAQPDPTRHASAWVLSIRDRTIDSDGAYLSFDVKDVLDALGPSVYGYTWVVMPDLWVVISDLDSTGPDAQELCNLVEATREQGAYVRMSGKELVHAAGKFEQTIDGLFIAIPGGSYDEEQLESMLDLRNFPSTDAQIAIEAIDSTLFEVYVKDPDQVRALRERFRDVRTESPDGYFRDAQGAWGARVS